MSDSDSDSDVIMGLMSLLDDPISPPGDISTLSYRKSLDTTIGLKFFGLNENGWVNWRDSTVLGEHTTIELPENDLKNADIVRLSLFLDHDVPFAAHTTVQVPKFLSKVLRATSSELATQHPVGNHQCWLRPSDLQLGHVVFQKRRWSLSRVFSKAAGVDWPNFIIVAEFFKNGTLLKTILSPNFEVRSKEQSSKNRASRGFSEPVRRRRTPETEARASKFRAIQAKIIATRDAIARETAKTSETTLRLNFIKAMTEHCPEASEIHKIVCRN